MREADFRPLTRWQAAAIPGVWPQSSEPACGPRARSAQQSPAVLIASLWVFISSTGELVSEGPHPLCKQNNMKPSVISCSVTHAPSGTAGDWNIVSGAPSIQNLAHRLRFPQPIQSLYFPLVKYLVLAAWIWILSSSGKLSLCNYQGCLMRLAQPHFVPQF